MTKLFDPKARWAVFLETESKLPEEKRSRFVLRGLDPFDDLAISDVLAEAARKRKAPAAVTSTKALREIVGWLKPGEKDVPDNLLAARRELNTIEDAFAAEGGRWLLYASEVVRRSITEQSVVLDESGAVVVLPRREDGHLADEALSMLGTAAIGELFAKALKSNELGAVEAGKS